MFIRTYEEFFLELLALKKLSESKESLAAQPSNLIYNGILHFWSWLLGDTNLRPSVVLEIGLLFLEEVEEGNLSNREASKLSSILLKKMSDNVISLKAAGEENEVLKDNEIYQ
jgi:hypothetical protein